MSIPIGPPALVTRSRQKNGRIVSGGAGGLPTDEWLSEGHRLAKVVTNAVLNRWGDGPDTPEGVRSRLARESHASIESLLQRVDDDLIEAAIDRARELEKRWASMTPGAKLRLAWPLDPSTPVPAPE